VIESLRAGRRTSCALTPGAATQLSGGSRRLARFALDAEEWDGVWTVVAFSLPEAHRDLRHLLRSRLRWHGFAPLYDGVWVSPNAGPDDVVAALAELEVPAMTVFRSEAVHRPGVFRRTPIEAWDLDDIAEQYRAFIARWEPILEQLREGSISSLEALIARTSIMDTYRRFPALDPQLPEAQMPQGWPRARAREVFVGAYDRLGPLAEVRVRQVIGAYDAATADAVRHHTIAGLIEGLQPVSPAR
jgi:phenylacetic acid degradation operon negative regulatory protein